MTIALLLLTTVVLAPWMVQFFRYVARYPEAIPTPSWMVTTNVLFTFFVPLFSGLVLGQKFTGHERAASWIMFTSVSYWIVFTAIYLTLSIGQRTIPPAGPHGSQTALGTLKSLAHSITPTKALAMYLPLMLIRIFFIKEWGLGLSGGGRAMMDLPYHLLIVYMLLPTATSTFTAVFGYHFFCSKSIAVKFVCGAALAANFIFAALVGRRPVLMFFGFVTLGMMWAGWRKKILPIVGLGLAAWFIFAVFSPVFLRARVLWRTPNGPGAIAAFRIAIEESSIGYRGDDLEQENAENITARMNTYQFWLEIYDRFNGDPLGGLALTQAVLMNTPRALIGLDKYIYGPTVEYLYETSDISNNVSLESFLDFGPLGPVVYGVLLGIVFFVIDQLCRCVAVWNKYAAMMVIGPMIDCLVLPEDTLIGYFSTLRNTVVIAVLALLIRFVVGRRSAVVASSVGRDSRGTRLAPRPLLVWRAP